MCDTTKWRGLICEKGLKPRIYMLDDTNDCVSSVCRRMWTRCLHIPWRLHVVCGDLEFWSYFSNPLPDCLVPPDGLVLNVVSATRVAVDQTVISV